LIDEVKLTKAGASTNYQMINDKLWACLSALLVAVLLR
jgi:hypothetical protein